MFLVVMTELQRLENVCRTSTFEENLATALKRYKLGELLPVNNRVTHIQ